MSRLYVDVSIGIWTSLIQKHNVYVPVLRPRQARREGGINANKRRSYSSSLWRPANALLQVRRDAKQRNVRCCKPHPVFRDPELP